MYGIDGRHELPEETLDHLDGYCGSRPVRLGNAASEQLQLDIYGELMDSIYLYDKYGTPIAYDVWTQIRKILDWVADNWMRPDDGIWEVRGGQQHFVYSKVQCWVALDRALRLANKRSLSLDFPRLASVRNQIHETVMSQGWDPQRRTFVQYFGTTALDASNLIMPLVFFISPTDPRMRGTLKRTMDELVSDSLVHRYEIGKGAGEGCPGRKARLTCAPSGWWRPSRGLATWRRRGIFLKKCSPMPIISASTPKKLAPMAKRWEISRKRLRT